MKPAHDFFAASWPDANYHFQRGYLWDGFKDRPPGPPPAPKPKRRRKVDPLAELSAELRRAA